MEWKLRTRRLVFSETPTQVMGILNATPDSFSDGGNFFDVDAAVGRGVEMAEAGVAIIDVGGESTRPYSEPVTEAEELRRVVPVIEAIAKAVETPISIDTSKAAVAAAAIEAGAEIINDVTGLEGDPQMIDVAIRYQVGICAMHMQGTPQTMQDDPAYDDVVGEIFAYLQKRKDTLLSAGVNPDRICLDPGIGFGKTHEHNLTLLANAEEFLKLGCPILVGHSRKGFVGKLLADKQVERDSGTLAISLMLAQQGIHVLRVHDAGSTVRALKVAQGLRR